MSKPSSFEKINYVLRPNKQAERKIIIDLLSRMSLDIPINRYQYVGMGSIYYYDFILFHKFLGITKMTSIDNKTCVNRFEFNKPYDFVHFENCFTTDYLYKHNYKENSIFWLDYDGHISGNESLKKDISLLGKNCNQGDFYFVSLNCETPKDNAAKKLFLAEFAKYIPPRLNHIKFLIPRNFPVIVQEIILNMIAESGEYHSSKFLKICSFVYKDGALMYTLGGIFTDDENKIKNKYRENDLFQFERTEILQIKIPNLTYQEKFYLDSNITVIKQLVDHSLEYWANKCVDDIDIELGLNDQLSKELAFELSYHDLQNYITNYRFVPQYFETMI